MLISQSNQKKSIEIKDLGFLEEVAEQDASNISGGDHPGMAPEGAYEEGVRDWEAWWWEQEGNREMTPSERWPV
jgi:hypothetical protein